MGTIVITSPSFNGVLNPVEILSSVISLPAIRTRNWPWLISFSTHQFDSKDSVRPHLHYLPQARTCVQICVNSLQTVIWPLFYASNAVSIFKPVTTVVSRLLNLSGLWCNISWLPKYNAAWQGFDVLSKSISYRLLDLFYLIKSCLSVLSR